MSALAMVQLMVDVAFVFVLLLLLLGRGWRRGTAGSGSSEDMEAYREMVSTLTVLIKEMKQSAADMQEKLDSRQVEISRAVAAADERLRALGSPPDIQLDRMAPSPRSGAGLAERIASSSPSAEFRIQQSTADSEPVPAPASGAGPVIPADPAAVQDGAAGWTASSTASLPEGPLQGERTLEEEERERAEKYRQVLEFAEKGWTAVDIARFLQVPRGEVDLLMRTKVRSPGGN